MVCYLVDPSKSRVFSPDLPEFKLGAQIMRWKEGSSKLHKLQKSDITEQKTLDLLIDSDSSSVSLEDADIECPQSIIRREKIQQTLQSDNLITHIFGGMYKFFKRHHYS